MEHLEGLLHKAKHGFLQTKECRLLTVQLKKIKKMVDITNVILIGPGSMDEFAAMVDQRRNVVGFTRVSSGSGELQLAAALKICEVLGGKYTLLAFPLR